MSDVSLVVLQTLSKGIINSLPDIWWLFALILVVPLGKFIYRLYEAKRLVSSGILEIDKMDGKTFEKYLEVLFKKLGYRVERTRYIGDFGADLVTVKNGVKTIIQAKRHKGTVGIKAVQEAVAAKGYYDCSAAMVVTNSVFTKQAAELARANGVILWERNDLVDALLSVKQEGSINAEMESIGAIEAAAAMEPVNMAGETCAICGQVVSEKVRQYCLDHSQRFSGKIYCFQHQKNVK
ncbi:MAG: restriction endonuclease [Syntrophomonas sp.]